MGKTKIEWAGESWNPIAGCTKISPGCDNCYALAMSGRISQMEKHPARYDGVTEVVDGEIRWTGQVNVDWDELQRPLRWHQIRTEPTFICSMGDLCHPGVPFEAITQVMKACYAKVDSEFVLLTKRPQRLRDWWWTVNGGAKFPPNLWLGISAESQKWLRRRAMALLEMHHVAEVLFVSLEPLLGPIWLWPKLLEQLDWVTIGFESGPNARVGNEEWLVDVLNDCWAYDVPVFVKQLGTRWAKWHRREHGVDPGYKGERPEFWPADYRVREWPT